MGPLLGRARDLDAVEGLLSAHGAVLVKGAPGVGKTALLGGLSTPRSAIVDASNCTAWQELEPRIIAAGHLDRLLIDAADELDAEAVTALLGLGVPVVVASRRRLPLPALHALAPLEARDAAALFVRVARRAGAVHDVDDPGVLDLVAAAGGLPSMIVRLGSRAHALGPRELLGSLTEGELQSELATQIEPMLEELGVATRRVLEACAVCPGGARPDDLRSLCPGADVHAALTSLVEDSLIASTMAGELRRYRTPPPIAVVVLRRCPPERLAELREARASRFLSEAERWAQCAFRRGGREARDAIEAEAANLLAIQQDAALEVASRAAIALDSVHVVSSMAADRLRILRSAAARDPDNAELHFRLGRALLSDSDHAASHATLERLALDERAPSETRSLAHSFARIAAAAIGAGEIAPHALPPTDRSAAACGLADGYSAYHRGGDLDEALERFDEALMAAWRSGDWQLELEVLRQRATLELVLGYGDAGRADLADAIELATQEGSSRTLHILELLEAEVITDLGEPEEGARRLALVAAHYAKEQNHALEGGAAMSLGDAYFRAGDRVSARRAYVRAERCLTLAPWGELEVEVRSRRALLQAAEGRLDVALRILDDPLWIAVARYLADGSVADLIEETRGSDRPRHEARWLVSLVASREEAPGPPAIRVAGDGAWLEVDGRRRRLRKTSPMSRLLTALARHHGPEPMSREDLLCAGWPGEKILEGPARNRLNVTLSRLRSLGLGSALRYDHGWLLAGAECVE